MSSVQLFVTKTCGTVINQFTMAPRAVGDTVATLIPVPSLIAYPKVENRFIITLSYQAIIAKSSVINLALIRAIVFETP